LKLALLVLHYCVTARQVIVQ